MKKLFLTLMATTITFYGSIAVAQEQYYPSGDDLQFRAEKLLESEDGASKATVRFEVSPQEKPYKTVINFMEFDLNGDGSLTHAEVGERLFKMFDTDGNQVIDNIEMKRVGILAFTPMTRKTIEIVEYAADGTPKKTNVSEEEFLKTSNLSKFDKDADGLTPLDFLEQPFNKVNVKRDGVIDLYEWKRAYADSVKPKHQEQFNYNG